MDGLSFSCARGGLRYSLGSICVRRIAAGVIMDCGRWLRN